MGFRYDFNSLLHYPEHMWTVNGERTMVAKKPGFVIPNNFLNSGLSPIDIAEVKTLYRCK